MRAVCESLVVANLLMIGRVVSAFGQWGMHLYSANTNTVISPIISSVIFTLKVVEILSIIIDNFFDQGPQPAQNEVNV